MEEMIKQFVSKRMASYDASHDMSHVERVVKTAWKIMDETDIEMLETRDFRPVEVVVASAYLHDVCDHKYVTPEDASQIEKEYQEMLGNFMSAEEIRVVHAIINNISYSKEKRLELIDLEEYQVLRDIVSDSDKLDALGNVGVERCIQYTKATHPEIKDEAEIIRWVVRHMKEKILRLSKYHIRTRKGKELAQPLHDETWEWYSHNVEKARELIPEHFWRYFPEDMAVHSLGDQQRIFILDLCKNVDHLVQLWEDLEMCPISTHRNDTRPPRGVSPKSTSTIWELGLKLTTGPRLIVKIVALLDRKSCLWLIMCFEEPHLSIGSHDLAEFKKQFFFL